MAIPETSSGLKIMLDGINTSLFKRLEHCRQTGQMPLRKDWALLAFVTIVRREPTEKGGYMHAYRHDQRIIFGQYANCISWVIRGGRKNKFKYSEILWATPEDVTVWPMELFRYSSTPLLRTSPTYRIVHSKQPLYGLLPTAT